MFCGALYFNGKKDGLDESATNLSQQACRYPHQEIKQLYKDECFALSYISRKNAPENEVLSQSGLGLNKSWFTDITGSHLIRSKEIHEKLINYNWNLPLNLDGQWIALQWNPTTTALKLATDFLGSVWLYIAKTKKGYLFAHDFAALFGHSDFNAEIDEGNLLVELGLGYNPDNSTIYKNITIVPPGAVIQLSEGGIETVAIDRPSYQGEYESFSEKEKFDFLDMQYEKIYHGAIANQLSDTCISLSAGLDSRYALALLQSHNTSCPAFTFGIKNSDEVHGATQVAALAKLSPTYYNFSDASWSGWRRCVEQLGNIGMIQWAGWAEEWVRLLSTNHRFVLIGYLGDALSGKHLVRNNPKGDWLTSWLDWSLDSWATSEFLREECRADIRSQIGTKLEKIADSINPVFPHQLAMHFDIYGRQRRWVASQPNLMSKFIYPKTYFLNKELVNFWTNLPYSDLDGQRLYKVYAESRFPRFFDRNEGRITLASRIKNKISNQVSHLLHGEKIRRVSHVIERDRVITQNLPAIAELMGKTESKLGHIMDFPKLYHLIEKFKKNGAISQADAGIILRGVNLMILVDHH